jgi:uncharacterized repeat protein (TIGR03843 family)
MTRLDVQPVLDEGDALRLLRHGEFEVEGRLVDASNTTLRGFLTLEGVTARCVYKPVRGEVSASLVSRATSWRLVPPTVLRDGPLGPGACQLWIDEPDDGESLVGFVPTFELPIGWFRIASARDEEGNAYALAHADDPRLARMAVFDAVINNGDRKGGHVLVGADAQVFGVDHGVSFNVDDKLRTVLWGWTSDRLPDEAVEVLERLGPALRGPLGEQMAVHLTVAEVERTRERLELLLATGRFPTPSDDWPAVPWPPI